jgi:hypothetical protein
MHVDELGTGMSDVLLRALEDSGELSVKTVSLSARRRLTCSSG